MTTYGTQHDAEYFRKMDRDQELELAMERRYMALTEFLVQCVDDYLLDDKEVRGSLHDLATIIVKKELRNGKQS